MTCRDLCAFRFSLSADLSRLRHCAYAVRRDRAYIIFCDRRWFPGAYDSHRVGLPNKRNLWPGKASIYRRLASAKVGDLVGTGHLRTYLRNNDSSLLMSEPLLRPVTSVAIINSVVLIVSFLRLDQTRLIATCKRFHARFLRKTRGLRYLASIYNRAFIAQFSRKGIIIRQFPRNMSERGLGKQTVSEPVARDHMYIFTTARDKTFDKRGSCFAWILYSRDTRRGGIPIFIYRSLCKSAASLFFRPSQLSRSHIIDDLSIHPWEMGFRSGAGNNNLRHTFFVSTNLSKRRHTFS